MSSQPSSGHQQSEAAAEGNQQMLQPLSQQELANLSPSKQEQYQQWQQEQQQHSAMIFDSPQIQPPSAKNAHESIQ